MALRGSWVNMGKYGFLKWNKIDGISEEYTWNLLNSFHELNKK